MITNEHKKHTDISKPSYGFYNRNEWAIAGTQCSAIKSLADAVIKGLSPQYKCAYADAKHTGDDEEATPPRHLESGAIAAYTAFHNYNQFNYTKTFNTFDLRRVFNDADIVIVNGNHF